MQASSAYPWTPRFGLHSTVEAHFEVHIAHACSYAYSIVLYGATPYAIQCGDY